MNEQIPVNKPTARMLYHLGRKGILTSEQQQIGVEAVGGIATTSQWHAFTHRILLILGLLTTPIGTIHFLSRWDEIGHLHKIGGMGVLLVATLLITTLFGLDKKEGKISISIATLFLGILLGIIGDTYASNSGIHTFFLTWSVLSLGWVAIGRFAPLWMGWQALATITLASQLYERTSLGDDSILLAPILMGAIAIPLWHIALQKNLLGKQLYRWPERATVIGTLLIGTVSTAVFFTDNLHTPLFSEHSSTALQIGAPIAILTTIATIGFYSQLFQDKILLIAGCVSGVLMGLAIAFRLLNNHFEFLAYIGLGLGAIVATTVLTKVVKENIEAKPSAQIRMMSTPEGDTTNEDA